MGSIFDNRAALPLEEEEEKILAPKPIVEQPKQQKSSIFANRAAPEEVEEVKAVKATKNSNKNSAIIDAARRFAEDRLGETEISDEEAIEEYIAHFRSFNVNELTAAGDYNYVSAAAADATFAAQHAQYTFPPPSSAYLPGGVAPWAAPLAYPSGAAAMAMAACSEATAAMQAAAAARAFEAQYGISRPGAHDPHLEAPSWDGVPEPKRARQ